MDPFATLGLPRRFDLDRDQLDRQYRELQRALHPDRHTGAPASQRRMTLMKAVEVNEAYRKLKNELSRAEALIALAAPQPAPAAEADRAADPAFLMQMMELREALGDAKAAADLARVRALASEVEALRAESRAALLSGFAVADDQVDWEQLRAHIARLKYYARFLDEVAVIEDGHA